MENSSNSFFQQSCREKKVLVLAPHQDDEINIAGSMICHFIAVGAQVFCAYSTNGDFQFLAATRIREAIKALRVLGVPEKQIFFLGYGDAMNSRGHTHIFYAKIQPARSPRGRTETYGTKEHPDYAWQKRGRHNLYCSQNYKQDLKEIILDIHPDVIFCVDYDQHADHRTLSLFFEEVMGEILCRPDNVYRPQIFKSLAYATAYEAVRDFYVPNILSTRRPKVGEMLGYPMDILTISIYDWQQRVRFPVSLEFRGRFLRNNRLLRALFQHYSQGPALHVENIISGDKVFWQRRTDNLACQAMLTASSGNAEYTRDFKILDAADVDVLTPCFKERLWSPTSEDRKKQLIFRWQKPQKVKQLRLYANLHEQGRILQMQIELDGKVFCQTGPMPLQGRPLQIDFSEERMVQCCSIKVIRASGIEYGLSECEILPAEVQEGCVKPFIKIMKEDQFIYEYWFHRGTKQIALQVYKYGIEDSILWKIQRGSHSRIADGVLHIGAEDDKLVIQACCCQHSEIYDTIVLERHNSLVFAWLWCRQQVEKRVIRFVVRKCKKYMFLRNKYLKDI